jgi:serine phosphatase RsbU (regulator of sigma subunit)
MTRLDISTGRLEWVNAGHHAPLLIRDHRVIRRLTSPGTLPVGFGGAQPQISELQLQRGDRLLFFTDGLVEEHRAGEKEFGEERLIKVVEEASRGIANARALVRGLSHTLMRERRGVTTDDATLLLVEWRGGSADHLATPGF